MLCQYSINLSTTAIGTSCCAFLLHPVGALGSTAIKQGRVIENDICGFSDTFPGELWKIVMNILDFTVGKTGPT